MEIIKIYYWFNGRVTGNTVNGLKAYPRWSWPATWQETVVKHLSDFDQLVSGHQQVVIRVYDYFDSVKPQPEGYRALMHRVINGMGFLAKRRSSDLQAALLTHASTAQPESHPQASTYQGTCQATVMTTAFADQRAFKEEDVVRCSKGRGANK